MKKQSLHHKSLAFSLLAGLILFASAAEAQIPVVIEVDREAVHQVRGRAENPTNNPLGFFTGLSGNEGRTVGVTGGGGDRRDYNIIYEYTLPELDVGYSIQSFEFSFQITGLRDHNGGNYALDVYLLDIDDPTVTGTDLFFHGESDGDHAFVGQRFIDTLGNDQSITLDPAVSVTFAINSGPALTLLQSFYDGHLPLQDTASFRFNLDFLFVNGSGHPISGQGLNRYILNNDASSFEITVIPEPSTYAALAGLLALGLVIVRRRAALRRE